MPKMGKMASTIGNLNNHLIFLLVLIRILIGMLIGILALGGEWYGLITTEGSACWKVENFDFHGFWVHCTAGTLYSTGILFSCIRGHVCVQAYPADVDLQ